MEESFRKMIRQEVDDALQSKIYDIAEQTVHEFQRHKRQRDEFVEREKSVLAAEKCLDERETHINRLERELREKRRKLDEDQAQFRKKEQALDAILKEKDRVKASLEMLQKREELLKEKDPSLFDEYKEDALQLTQPAMDDEDELNEHFIGKYGGRKVQRIVDNLDKLENEVYDREPEKDGEDDGVLSLELSFGDEGYHTP